MSLKNEEEKVSIFQSIYKYMYTDKAVQPDGRTKEHGVLNHQYGQNDNVDRREHKDKKEARFSLSSLSNGISLT